MFRLWLQTKLFKITHQQLKFTSDECQRQDVCSAGVTVVNLHKPVGKTAIGTNVMARATIMLHWSFLDCRILYPMNIALNEYHLLKRQPNAMKCQPLRTHKKCFAQWLPCTKPCGGGLKWFSQRTVAH